MEPKDLTIPKSQKLNIWQILNYMEVERFNDIEATKIIIYESCTDLMIRKWQRFNNMEIVTLDDTKTISLNYTKIYETVGLSHIEA